MKNKLALITLITLTLCTMLTTNVYAKSNKTATDQAITVHYTELTGACDEAVKEQFKGKNGGITLIFTGDPNTSKTMTLTTKSPTDGVAVKNSVELGPEGIDGYNGFISNESTYLEINKTILYMSQIWLIKKDHAPIKTLQAGFYLAANGGENKACGVLNKRAAVAVRAN